MNTRADIEKCVSFSKAINILRFEVNVPEYYDPFISNYFTRPMQGPKPMVNGVEVEWEEYSSLTGEYKQEELIPPMIYQSESHNMSSTFQTIPGIIDLTINDVEYEMTNFDDIEYILNIMQGYRSEIYRFIAQNATLKTFIDNMDMTYQKLNTYHKQICTHRKNLVPVDKRPPMSLLEILKYMKG